MLWYQVDKIDKRDTVHFTCDISTGVAYSCQLQRADMDGGVF